MESAIVRMSGVAWFGGAVIALIAGCGSSDKHEQSTAEDAGQDAATEAGPPISPDGQVQASFVIGQPSATVNEGVRIGLTLPNDVAIVGSRLVVADQSNNRVLVWNAIPTQNHEQADLVLGQPDFSTAQPDYDGVTARSFHGTNGVASDGTHLVVADRFNFRVLIWNTFPSSNFQPADVVLGQPDFTSNTSNNGGVSARSLTEPMVWLAGGKLFVADRYNARVLIWNTIPTQSYAPADMVLGQPDKTSATVNNGGLGPSSFAEPVRGWVDGTRLFVPDIGNHRVLVWNAIPTSDNAPADLVLGQSSMTAGGANGGGAVSASSLNMPMSVYASGSTTAVADYGNNRVLIWTAPITTSGQTADVILGQTTASGSEANAGGVTASSLSNPNAVVGDGTRFVVSDRFNHRVLIFPTVPSSTGAPASLAIGQPDLVSGRLNNPGGPLTGLSFFGPSSATQMGQGFAVTDSGNARVLVWSAPPASASDAPAFVLGQPDFASSGLFGDMNSAESLCAPASVHSDGTRLAVGEQCSSRVSIWSSLPAATQQPIDLVVGQPDLTSSTPNNGGISASSLSRRPQPHLDGGRMFVADPNNNRILIWNAIPTMSGSAANVVLGQPDMASAVANEGGVSAQSLSRPEFVYTSGEKLFVADTDNHRVLIWNAVPTTDRAPANVVLGQPDMTSAEATPSSSRTLRSPSGVHVDAEGRLYVVDTGNHRILYWNSIPISNQTAADGVIGQNDMTSGFANDGGITLDTLQSPGGVVALGEQIYVLDTGNDRIIVLPRP